MLLLLLERLLLLGLSLSSRGGELVLVMLRGVLRVLWRRLELWLLRVHVVVGRGRLGGDSHVRGHGLGGLQTDSTGLFVSEKGVEITNTPSRLRVRQAPTALLQTRTDHSGLLRGSTELSEDLKGWGRQGKMSGGMADWLKEILGHSMFHSFCRSGTIQSTHFCDFEFFFVIPCLPRPMPSTPRTPFNSDDPAKPDSGEIARLYGGMGGPLDHVKYHNGRE